MKTSGQSLRGRELIDEPLWNKGTAFSEGERAALGLYGLLPPHVETLEEQASRAYEAFGGFETEIERHVYLRSVQDTNEVLFYRLVIDHLAEMMPIIYTPVVGAACQQFSEIYRRPRGLFVPYPHRDRIEEMLRNYVAEDVEAIVVTDGERILGLGDQGAGGMGIPIGKLSLYVACGGIHPKNTLPILLDVGTNNEERLKDPHYIGWRHERVAGDEYIAFVDAFVDAVKKVWPHVLLQFEDFAFQHATPLLGRYRDQLCMFNDDVQGTAAVALGTLFSAVNAAGSNLCDQTVAILGGGSAGCGIAEQIVAAMGEEGLSDREARDRIYMVDRPGLLHDGMTGLPSFQEALAQPQARLESWTRNGPDGGISMLDVAQQGKPTILIGVSGQPGLFTEEILRAMAAHSDRPIVFPLSNPTSRMEAAPADVIKWTEGRALVATGSPIDPVSYDGRTFPIAQCNNTYIFPAVGLGVIASGAKRVTDEMMRAAARALGAAAPASKDPTAALLPPLAEIRRVTRDLAEAVGAEAQRQGHAEKTSPEELRRRIDERFWEPAYSGG
ncbi:MAG: NAD-dependent malic enzyme [Candidatus Binatia bacterium]|nr:NAD-dependent malic enzyme [Candidatus Binatia bacterium]